MNNFSSIISLLRLDKPIGIYLLLWPTIQALLIANNGAINIKLLIVFILGAIVTRSLGCIINDFFDKDFDKQVTRTKTRPLAQNTVSYTMAAYLVITLLLASVALMSIIWSIEVFLLSVIALILLLIYPLMKRIIYYPQVVLAFAYSMAILIAYVAIKPIDLIAIALYLINFVWVISYDTYYAMLDKEDDLKAGVKSIAILFNGKELFWIAILQLFFLIGWCCIANMLHFSSNFSIAIVVVLMFFIYFLYKTRNGGYNNYYQAFSKSHIVGLLILFALFYEYNIKI